MKNNLFSPPSCEDDTSDSLSTTNSFSHFSADTSSFFQQSSDMTETEPNSPQGKKIRKKRNAYGKIDDDKRLQLLEAVQQRGETLKAASKRLGINYSSAKSIIHTYRKEGRILKKSVCSLPYTTVGMNPFESSGSIESYQFQMSSFSPFDFHQAPITVTKFIENSPPSPTGGLTGALGHLALVHQNRMEEQAQMRPQTYTSESTLIPRLPLADISMTVKANSCCPAIPISNPVPEEAEAPAHPRELFKDLDNFYMNYSNSPLSGGKGNMYAERADSSSHRCNPREFDSFSDLVDSFQNPSRVEEHKSLRFSQNPSRFGREENVSFSCNMENTAKENYKNLVEAQWMLTDSFQRPSYLNNNLARMPNTGISPRNGWAK